MSAEDELAIRALVARYADAASRTMHVLYHGAMDPGVVMPLPPRGPQQR